MDKSRSNLLIVTESHLNNNILDAEIQMEGYDLIRGDRKERSHGGVAIYTSSNIISETLLTFSNTVCELVIMKLPQINHILVTIYRPPDTNCTEFREMINTLLTTLRVLDSPLPDISIFGDFNFPNVKWPEGEILPGNTRDEQNQINPLSQLCEEFYLEQKILHPTREKNILDLVFTNNEEIIHHYDITKTIMSDHNLIELTLNYNCTTQDKEENYPSKPSTVFDKLNLYKADWKSLTTLLNDVNWEKEFNDLNTVEKLERFNAILSGCCKNTVPRKRSSKPMKSRVPHKRKVLMRKRCKTKRKLKATTSLPARKKLEKKLQEIEQNLKSSHINERRMSEKKAIENIKVNSKFFFSYAKKYSKTIDGVGPLLDSAKNVITGAKSICELLRQQYESVFSKPRKATENQDDPNKFFSKRKSKLADIAFTTDDIKSAINELSANAASGPDGLPAVFVKEL